MRWAAATSIALYLIVFRATPCLAEIAVRSGDTAITLEAGRQSPHLLKLCLGDSDCWRQTSVEPLIAFVEVAGKQQAVHWKFNENGSKVTSQNVELAYDSDSPHLRLTWIWIARAARGPIEHTIKIQNLGENDLWLPLQDSLRFSWQVSKSEALEQLWVEKGAGGPTAEGTHRISLHDGYKWVGTSSTYAHPAVGQQREMIPYLLVDRPEAGGSGWYLGIEFSGRTRITLARNRDLVEGVAGLNPEPGPFRTHLGPGESFETPTIFLGAFSGGPDDAANALRRWIRNVLNNPATVNNPRYPLVVNNSWGSGMAINESQARSMIRDSAGLGFEMFHLDAGWFRGVGDWYPDPAKFPHGLAPVADYAHSLGLEFGLWMDWAQAGPQPNPSSLSARDPKSADWLTVDPPPNWKPPDEFKGVTMDIGVPAVHDWAAVETSRVVRDYHLDMLEHDGYVVAQGCDRSDHPHAPPDFQSLRRFEDSGFFWVEGNNSTDVSYYATRSYYSIHSSLRRQYPNLLLEICNDGGRMVDFGSAAHGDYFSISDAYDPLSNRRAFYDSSYVLPPAMLECYVEKSSTLGIANLLYALRSGMMGWFTLMLDTTAWTPDLHTAAREAIAVYKSRLRPLIRSADLYHVSQRPDGVHWDGMEYYDPASQRGVLFAFRGSSHQERQHSFVLHGLDPAMRYRLTYQDKSSPDRIITGKELMETGVEVALQLPESSELVFINKASE
jgi:hypothetical protein